MRKFLELTYIVTGLEVLDGWPIFSAVACRSFVCKHRRTGEAKTKLYIFVYKIFTNNFLKSYATIAM